MTTNELKALVGQAALTYVVRGEIVGMGTGSTVNYFIDARAVLEGEIKGAVSRRERSSDRLRALGIPVLDANQVTYLPVYVDGANEIDAQGCMIKGGGATLTREKIVADLAERFVCIADTSKQVRILGLFRQPLEVIPMAATHVARKLEALGGKPVLRAGVVTDNGGHILDVHGLSITDPVAIGEPYQSMAGSDLQRDLCSEQSEGLPSRWGAGSHNIELVKVVV